ncbi:MAG: D-xylose transporter ATP-binding protein [Clostridia bacterium]|nr:D-xylose transporter ATP-binding protein [Clostridia bacterium]
MDKNLLLDVKGISKSFPGVKALSDVSFSVETGEVHAIVGENGAGKSTLMNILSGGYGPDEGSVFFQGKELKLKNTRDAQESGIAMIHQELSLAPHLSIMENIYIGRLETNKLGYVNYKKMAEKCKLQLECIGIRDIDPRRKVKDLSVSQMQMVEIAKALSLEAKLLIMDEPTSSLTSSETEMLIAIINSLKASGVSILFISHRMEEVFRISDKITILRDGQYIKTIEKKDAEVKQVLSLMVGREFDKAYNRAKNVFTGKPILEVKGLRDKSRIKDISFEVHPGEVVAITGLVGAGRTEVIQTIFGVNKKIEGEILVDGKKVNIKSPIDAIKLGIGLIPEGRKTQGLCLDMTVRENISMSNLQIQDHKHMMDLKQEISNAEEYIQKLSIKTPGMEQKIKYLSGGNQQKAIISRWLLNKPKILFLDEPTHGVDIGAKSEIYEIIDELSKSGVGIVLISSELPEVLMLADRILVMHEGMIKGELGHHEATQENIMEYAANQF